MSATKEEASAAMMKTDPPKKKQTQTQSALPKKDPAETRSALPKKEPVKPKQPGQQTLVAKNCDYFVNTAHATGY
jgi:hypothetical protein